MAGAAAPAALAGVGAGAGADGTGAGLLLGEGLGVGLGVAEGLGLGVGVEGEGEGLGGEGEGVGGSSDLALIEPAPPAWHPTLNFSFISEAGMGLRYQSISWCMVTNCGGGGGGEMIEPSEGERKGSRPLLSPFILGRY